MRGAPTDAIERLNAALADRYRVERELGAGGMATVYLAEDLRHHRRVAVKVLRAELAAVLGPERFLREIETTAQLTHPHILPLLDSGDAGGALFYVMPFVEGESLRDRLAREKQLPLDEALRIAREAADALAYAHAHGVIHRDIKPENILLESGHAVIADFGIARALDRAGGEHLTETGVTLGTPAYMSPEQGTGSRDLDGRSDVYSLACVLYEMLSGETPYTGPTPMAIVARKLADPLPRISVVRETVSPAIEAVLAKALARMPADRYATAGDFAAALARAETAGGGAVLPLARPGRLTRLAAWAAAAVALTASALAVRQLVKPKPLNITVSEITPVTSDPGVEFQPAISPNGSEVAYLTGSIRAPHLYVRSTVNVAGGASVRLGDSTLGSQWLPSWTPDGQFVRFLSCPGEVDFWHCGYVRAEIGRLGGATRPATLPASAANRRQLAWSADGARIAFVGGDTIFIVPLADTTRRRLVIHTQKYLGLHALAWSPDGVRIAYVNGNPSWLEMGTLGESSIWIVNADGDAPQQVVGDEHLNVSPAWLDASHLLFVSDRDGPRAVYAVEVGPHGRRGEPRAVPGVTDPHSISYSISAHRLVYSKLAVRKNIWAYPLKPPAASSIRDGRQVTSGSQEIGSLEVSPDNKWIVYTSDLSGHWDLYKLRLAGGAAVPLTISAEVKGGPTWSPDGREIAFSSSTAGSPTGAWLVKVMPAAGGASSPLAPGGCPAWSPNGLQLAYEGAPPTLPLWLLERDSVGAKWRAPRQLTRFPCYCPSWASDGSGVVCPWESSVTLISPSGAVLWRRDTRRMSGLLNATFYGYGRDGKMMYLLGTHPDGRQGIWAMPALGGAPHLVIAFDDPALVSPVPQLGIGSDQLYLTVSQRESDIWVATLTW